MSEADIELGGHIVLSGFSEIDSGSLVIVKKIVGSFAKKLSESVDNFEQLKVTVKPVHKGENAPAHKFEIKILVMAAGRPVTSEVTENNLFVVLDKALKKVETLLTKS